MYPIKDALFIPSSSSLLNSTMVNPNRYEIFLPYVHPGTHICSLKLNYDARDATGSHLNMEAWRKYVQEWKIHTVQIYGINQDEADNTFVEKMKRDASDLVKLIKAEVLGELDAQLMICITEGHIIIRPPVFKDQGVHREDVRMVYVLGHATTQGTEKGYGPD